MASQPEDTPTATSTTTLTDVLARYAESGFDASFTALPDAQLECHTCSQTFGAADAPMASLRRMEGASDPADMLAVVALTCPHCGAQGTAVLGYGPDSTAEDADVLAAFRDVRGRDDLPANSAPGEAAGDAGPTTS